MFTFKPTYFFLYYKVYYIPHNSNKVRLREKKKKGYLWPRQESMIVPKKGYLNHKKFLPLVPICDSNAVHKITLSLTAEITKMVKSVPHPPPSRHVQRMSLLNYYHRSILLS